MANAFHVIAPQSSACTSSSKKPCYDVFINHRGKDVKHKLASTIYNMLDLMGVQAFLDQEELEVGDFFPQAIEEALRSASVHITIFSPSYAESPWCLEELSLMLQINVAIIPVFYGVDPSDLRYVENGKYADAFSRLERKGRYNLGKIEQWKDALKRVSYVNGAILHSDKCDEGKLLREIVDSALHNIKKVPLEVATFPVGLDEAVQDFESKVGSSTGSENVHVVGLVGMGGSGKTTLAKELYNRKCSSISRSSFLFNVRDAASKNILHNLQEKLLRDLHIRPCGFDNLHEGRDVLARSLESTTVLVVLDDVDCFDQTEALLPRGMMLSLGKGSFIIVTTREVDVLRGISSIYHMKPLDYSNAKLLFCRHAFLHPYSQLGSEHLLDNSHKFQGLIARFVEACKGLPLSLKIFGAMVNRKPEAYCKAQLLKISRILPQEIGKHLRVSYDTLDREVRQMFLDVACFFIGERKIRVVSIWDGAGWSGEAGWETLVNKCLVGLDSDGRINMHDHLRDLGREIAENVTPSRIWKEEHISNQIGRTQIRGIVLDGIKDYCSTLEHCMEEIRPSLRALQLLAVKGNDFKEEFVALSRDLLWLRWHDFNGANLAWLSLVKLRVLELNNARNLKELWQDNDNVQRRLQLRELIIVDCPQLEALPDLTNRVYLRELRIVDCPQLELSSDLTTLVSLRELVLRYTGIRELQNIGRLRKLETLVIDGAKNLKELWQDNVQLPLQLRKLIIAECPQLEELPGLTSLVSLRELELYDTGLRELPNNIGQLHKLESLVIGSHKFTSLPESLGELCSLTSLKILHCERLESLPQGFRRGLGMRSPWGYNLKSLKYLHIAETRVCRISISDECCPSLETLDLRLNKYLTEIETLPGNVREIRVSTCEKLKNMRGGLLNLQILEVRDCPDLAGLPCRHLFCWENISGCRESISGCPKLKRLSSLLPGGWKGQLHF